MTINFYHSIPMNCDPIINSESTIKCWLESATARLSERTDDPYQNAKRDAVVLLCAVLGKNEAYLRAFDEMLLTNSQLAQLETYLFKRLQGEPIAYILGEREFWSLPIKVNSSTLIPRADTECLIEFALSLLHNQMQHSLTILDLGTGTGAIALALAKELNSALIIGVDKSLDAVELAKLNRENLRGRFGGFDNVHFLQSDWFSVFQEQAIDTNIAAAYTEKLAETFFIEKFTEKALSLLELNLFDFIISNPPYIAQDDLHLQQGDVRFEPITALVANDDGLADIKLIINQSLVFLKPTGFLMLEHGWQQAQQVQHLLKEAGYQSVTSHQDYAGQFRFTVASK